MVPRTKPSFQRRSGWDGASVGCCLFWLPNVNRERLSYCLTPTELTATIKLIFCPWILKPWLSQPIQLTRVCKPTCLLGNPIVLGSRGLWGIPSLPCSIPATLMWPTGYYVLQLITHFKTFSRQDSQQSPAQGLQDFPPCWHPHHYPVLLNTVLPGLSMIHQHHHHHPPACVSPSWPQRHYNRF